MLRAIHIKRFGAFADRSFAVGEVTVFGGANQSGKSTLFDAIRIHTFHPERRGRIRALYARYGDDTDVRLDWSGEPPDMSDGEFMNLFAVSSGNVQVDFDGDWLAAVRKNLFTGGIDPRNLMETFERLASEKGTYAHMRERSRLERQREEAESRLDTLTAQRDEILSALDTQEAARGGLQALEARRDALRESEAELAAQVARQEQIAEGGRLKSHLTLLDEIAALEQAQQKWPHLAQERTGELDDLERRSRASEAKRIGAEEALRAEQRRLDALRAELAALAGELAARGQWRGGVEALQGRLAAYDDGKLTRQLMRGVAALLLFLSGLAAMHLLGATVWGWSVLAAALLAAVSSIYLPGWLDEWRLKRTLKDHWRNLLGGTHLYGRAQAVYESQTLAGLTTALAQLQAELERLEADHGEKSQATGSQQARVAELEREQTLHREESESAAAALRDWLAAMLVGSRDEYRDKLGEYRRVQQQLGEAYGRLETALRDAALADGFQLRAHAEGRLEALRADSIPSQGLAEAERSALRERLEAARTELEKLEEEHHALDRASHGTSERLVGRLGNLPDEIADLGERLRQIDVELAALEFDRRAAERALELFREVAADESAVLADLSAGVAQTFARLSGVEETRQAAVDIAALRTEDIRALDRHGYSRPVEHLSSGAQHLLYLALRLEMARRERQGRFALLCLDEPFAFLDPERQLETLQYLKGFLEETGWQLILFTNEPMQAERARSVFPDCQLHTLT